MPSEYLHWKSTRIEISLLETEITCIISRHSPMNVEWKNGTEERYVMREHFLFPQKETQNIFVK